MTMRYEGDFTRQIDRSIDDNTNRAMHRTIKSMHPEAVRILKEDAIDPNDFIDLYGEENVQRDLDKVEKTKSGFDSTESKPAAEVFEALVYQNVELSNWLGPNAETIRVSEFDDIMNHVDLIVEFTDESAAQHLALGVDVTFGSISMQKKFDRIKSEIDEDKLADVKYFKAHGYRGSLEQVPRIVIGVDIDKVVALAGYWERKDKRALSNHIVKDIIMKEIVQQLQTFLSYAQSKKNSQNAVTSYTRAINTIRKINTDQNGFSSDKLKIKSISEDKVYQGIMKNLEKFATTSPSH